MREEPNYMIARGLVLYKSSNTLIIGYRDNAQKLSCHRRFPCMISKNQGGFLYLFSVSKSPLEVFEAGYRKNFQN